MLACLDRKPDPGSQSAAELRRRLEACAVEPCDRACARTWWLEHPRELDSEAVSRTSAPRTIAVDGTPRVSSELAG